MSQSIVARIKGVQSVGWGFFAVSCTLLTGPGIYLAWISTYEDSTTTGTRIAFGFIMAFVASGFITFIVNDLLHRRNVRRIEAERKADRKAKKKKKK